MWLLCGFVFTLFQCITQTGQNGCKDVHSISGYSLTGHAYRTLSGVRMITCIVTCEDDPECHSINFKFTHKLCELNNTTRQSAESKYFVPSEDYVYLNKLHQQTVQLHRYNSDTSKPCDYSPCKYGGSCSNTNYQPGFVCNCQTGYTGPTCEGKGQWANNLQRSVHFYFCTDQFCLTSRTDLLRFKFERIRSGIAIWRGFHLAM